MEEQHEIVVLLRQCIRSKDARRGVSLHAAIGARGLDRVKLIQDLLVHMYAKCGRLDRAVQVFQAMDHPTSTSFNILAAAYAANGRLDDARATFDRNPAKDTVSWNTLISAFARAGRGHQALALFQGMERDEVTPNVVTYLGVIQACASLRDLETGKSIHDRIVAIHPRLDPKLAVALINMFGRCRCVARARAVFDRLDYRDTVAWNVLMSAHAQNGHLEEARAIFFGEMPPEKRSVVSWNVIISACAQAGRAADALELFHVMGEQGFEADDVTFLAALDASSVLGDLKRGEQIHCAIIRSRGRVPSLKVGNALISMYGKCGSPGDAWNLFCRQETRDVVSWNAALAALAQNGRVAEARQLFDRMPCRDVVSWNTMISALARSGLPGQAIQLLSSMTAEVKANAITFVSAVDACAGLGVISEGRKLHRLVREAGCELELNVQNSLINMYGKCGSVGEARGVYDGMPYRDVVSWNGMLAAYCANGHLRQAKLLFDEVPDWDVISWNIMVAGMARGGRSRDALRLFASMDVEAIETDEITVIAVLDACGSLSDLAAGREIQGLCTSISSSTKVWNSLIYFYGRCKRSDEARSTFDRMKEWDLVSWTAMVGAYSLGGDLEAAKACFEAMPEHDVAAWNAMLTAFIQNGCGSEALASFKLMEARGIDANEISLTSIPEACLRPPAHTKDAEFVYARSVSSGIRSVLIDNALIRMLGKCCNAARARRTFNQMSERSVVSWNSMVAAYAHSGHLAEAGEVATHMIVEGEMPNEVTSVILLASYSHAGMLFRSIAHFVKMQREFWILPEADHFSCMVDVLARSGRLRDAEQLVATMSYEPDMQVWLALVGGCNMHGHVQGGALAAQQAWELDPQSSAPYILTSNLYKASPVVRT
ncbi:pentatricopeptide repeat-containing protein At2g36980, mitochondrial-like [Selaginella moellendorffii]|uniref:pentatricopeptide repeat-containing protein At2g36980, mitochondrial-like n=1 Tax=Selaginella moellendorffii TaxID=88036 RepID=UPI000D1CF116|nr:pentatricopeptide repeat-containing protein At2g36980, mitochondrial-like [Selaginella moellendorffii]|eukprot:XP_024523363.1 pentatricopeptide repeat-containing protein At2g36980, mitochondrial-like [Selaginella moellendorffii]